MIRRPPRSPLFPYPTLFRSRLTRQATLHSNVVDDSGVGDLTGPHWPFRLGILPRPGGVGRTSCIDLITGRPDRKSTRLNSSHLVISYAVFCLKKKKSIAASR